jgi:hypothetical protein
MKQMRGVLAIIQDDPTRAVEALRVALETDFEGFLDELAAFIVAALDGAVPDP